jgi:co-chaperonin GroES (HSP10)
MSNKFDEDKGTQAVNTAGIYPKGHAVLGLPYEAPKKDSRIVLPDTVKERTQMLQDRVRVIAVGAACWNDEPCPRARVGDLVLIPYLSGRMVRGKDGILYRMINDRDVIAEVEEFDIEV